MEEADLRVGATIRNKTSRNNGKILYVGDCWVKVEVRIRSGKCEGKRIINYWDVNNVEIVNQ